MISEEASVSCKSANLDAQSDSDGMVISRMLCARMGGNLKQDVIEQQRTTHDKKIFVAYMIADVQR